MIGRFMAEKTLFEHILSGDIPSHKVGSGEGWYAFLDIFPRREGHTLVIPTTAVSRMRDLSPLERSQLMEGVVEVQRLLTIKFNTTDFTVVVHDGPLAGQEVPHVHLHVLPRTENDSGKTLAAMWPHQSQETDHDKLRVLALELQTEGE
jgi:histidine triad (HIT) family protein